MRAVTPGEREDDAEGQAQRHRDRERGRDPGCQLGRATPVDQIEQCVHVVPGVASEHAGEAIGKAGVTQAIEVLSPMIRKAQREGRWPRRLNPESAARVMIAILQGISLQLAWDDTVDIASFAAALRIMIDPPA